MKKVRKWLSLCLVFTLLFSVLVPASAENKSADAVGIAEILSGGVPEEGTDLIPEDAPDPDADHVPDHVPAKAPVRTSDTAPAAEPVHRADPVPAAKPDQAAGGGSCRETAPAGVAGTAGDPVSAGESAPAEPAAPAEDFSPAEKAAPAEEPGPAADPVPAGDHIPAEAGIPAENPVPCGDSSPDGLGGAAGEAAPVDGTDPAGNPSPAEGLPDSDAVPSEVVIPDEDAAPAGDAAPPEESSPAGNPAFPEEPVSPESSGPADAEPLPEEEFPAETGGSGPERMVPDALPASADEETEYGAVTVTLESDDHLTLIVSGVTGQSAAELITQIENGIDMTLDEEKHSLNIRISDLLDAEKYSTVLSGYDKNLCWAATAANMLWSSGYAQCAVNPATGKAFADVDEVFHYFRGIFTDEFGVPDGAISVFMDGSYPYADSFGAARLTGTPEGLLPEADYQSGLVDLKSDYTDLSLLEYQSDVSFGVLLHGIGRSFSHWLTAVGLVLDETASAAADRYKAIILADSDNSPPGNDSEAADPSGAAAQAPNSFTVYRLTLENENDSPVWTIWYADTFHASVAWLLYLVNNPNPEKPGGNEAKPEEETGGKEQKPVKQIDQKPSASRASGSDYFEEIKARMVRENLLMYSPACWNYTLSEAVTFRVYVRTSVTFLTDVYVDGQTLVRGRDYTVSDCGNGMFLLVLSRDALQVLPAGEHMLRLSLTHIEGAEHAFNVF